MNDGFLTTHVLDTARGLPAAGLRISLYALQNEARAHLATMTTNADGRTESPILGKEAFDQGQYELIFHAGPYLATHHSGLSEPLFLDDIPIRFGISDATSHYHVPLLLSPFGYSTYRGS